MKSLLLFALFISFNLFAQEPIDLGVHSQTLKKYYSYLETLILKLHEEEKKIKEKEMGIFNYYRSITDNTRINNNLHNEKDIPFWICN